MDQANIESIEEGWTGTVSWPVVGGVGEGS
jgi:hypothetical protein